MFLSDNAIDVSGTPKERVIVGLVSFNSHMRAEIIKEFYKNFPNLKRSKWKATKLDEKVLYSIIAFLDKKDVKMYAIEFSVDDWKKWRFQLKDYAYFYERIYAILYYRLIKSYCWKKYKNTSYEITLCQEQHIDFRVLLDTLRRLCKAGKYVISFNTSQVKYNDLIRFADFVAGSFRKINKSKISKFKNFKIISSDLDMLEVNKAFRLT